MVESGVSNKEGKAMNDREREGMRRRRRLTWLAIFFGIILLMIFFGILVLMWIRGHLSSN